MIENFFKITEINSLILQGEKMKKLLTVQLGLILALASSSAFAAKSIDDTAGRADTSGLAGDHRDDITKAATTAGRNATQGTVADLQKGDRKREDKVMPKVGERSPEQRAQIALEKILQLPDLGAKKNEVTAAITGHPPFLPQVEAISKIINKDVETILANCEL